MKANARKRGAQRRGSPDHTTTCRFAVPRSTRYTIAL